MIPPSANINMAEDAHRTQSTSYVDYEISY